MTDKTNDQADDQVNDNTPDRYVEVGHTSGGENRVAITVPIENAILDAVGEQEKVCVTIPHSNAEFLAAAIMAYIPENRWHDVMLAARRNRFALAETLQDSGESLPVSLSGAAKSEKFDA